jgi:hypothetical protein
LGTVGGDANGDTLLSVGTFSTTNPQKVAITLGHAQDFSVECLQPISTFTATDWLNTNGTADHLYAMSIGSVKITGNTASNVAGDLDANVVTYGDQTLGSVSVAGFVRNATIEAAYGSIGTVDVGGLDHSNVFAGIDSRPSALADLANAHSIGSFTMHTIENVTNQFIDSQVAAASISKIVARGVVDTQNGGTAFGFVAHKVGSYTGPTTADDYSVLIL